MVPVWSGLQCNTSKGCFCLYSISIKKYILSLFLIFRAKNNSAGSGLLSPHTDRSQHLARPPGTQVTFFIYHCVSFICWDFLEVSIYFGAVSLSHFIAKINLKCIVKLTGPKWSLRLRTKFSHNYFGCVKKHLIGQFSS